MDIVVCERDWLSTLTISKNETQMGGHTGRPFAFQYNPEQGYLPSAFSLVVSTALSASSVSPNLPRLSASVENISS